MFKYFVYQLAQFVVKFLPIKVAYGLGLFLADLVYLFSFRDRALVTNNLKHILPNDELKNIKKHTREVFRNFGRYLVEFFCINNNADLEFIKKNVTINNIEYLDQVLEKGNGGVIMTAHTGNWELGAIILSLMGYPLTAIALPHKERPVNDLFDQKRKSKGVNVVPVSQAIKKSYEALRRNEFVAILADRDFSRSGEEIEFFNRKARIPKGTALFCLKGKCPIIPTFLMRDENNKFILDVCEPIYYEQFSNCSNERESMLQIMERYARLIEEKIREYPTQWLMFQKFWVDQE